MIGVNMKINKHQVPVKRREPLDELKYKVTLSITVLCSLLLIGYGTTNLIVGKLSIGEIELFIGAFLLIINLYLLRVKKHLKIPALLLNSMACCLTFYLFIGGGFHNTGLFWILSFPALNISTSGKKHGLVWIIFHISALLIIFVLSKFGVVTIAYDEATSLAALIVYLFICYILFSYEINRGKYKSKIQKLEGLLPICSYCKKIRDDKNTWHSIDSYLTRKADMDFTHGICPDCMKANYPEYYQRMKNKSK